MAGPTEKGKETTFNIVGRHARRVLGIIKESVAIET